MLIRPHNAAERSFAGWPANASSWKALACFTWKVKSKFDDPHRRSSAGIWLVIGGRKKESQGEMFPLFTDGTVNSEPNRLLAPDLSAEELNERRRR